MSLSEIANKIQYSNTRSLYEKSKEYTDVIDLTLGDPDIPTPQDVCEAGCEAILSGKTNYTANAGLLELRKVIADKVKKDTGIDYNPQTNVIVTIGAMGALYLLIKSVINEGDEVLIPAPAWVNYGQMVCMSGGIPIYVNGDERDFSLSVEALEKAVTDRTKMIIINSPCNPTGEVMSNDTLNAIAEIAEKHDLLVVSDEAYSSIVFDDAKFTSIMTLPRMNERTILIDSCSKRYSMTGWRCGFAVGDPDIISAMTRLQENVASCCPQPSQYAAIQALSGNQQSVENMRAEYEKRRNILVDGINRIPGLSCRKPQGTFYAFVNIKEIENDSLKFAYDLLDKVQVAVVPGITYGEAGEGYVRIAFTQNEDKLKEAIRRLEKYAKR